MRDVERFDAVVVGSGEGGKYLAWHLAQQGEKVAVVERRWIGGSCPNINCLPTKNEIYSAGIAHLVTRADAFGVRTGPVSVDMGKVLARKRAMVDALVAFHLDRYRATGAELIMGNGHLVAPRTVEVSLNAGGTRRLAADKLFLNLGTRATLPDIPGLADARPMTHIEALELDRVPDHLVALGGGYVGLELAQAWRRFGSRVTVIDRGDRLLRREDREVSEEVLRILKAEGIDLLLSSEAEQVDGVSGNRIRLVVGTPDGQRTLAGSDLLVAAGRTPNTMGIGLEQGGIALTEHGYVVVNDRLETTAPGAWAIGECAGSPQFTHMSLDDFRVVRDNLGGGARSTTGRMTPYCMFIDPPLARVGMSEGEARASGASVRVARLPMKSVLRTRTTGQTDGFMTAVVGQDDSILGFAMIGQDAGEVMAVVQTAMMAKLPYTALRDSILAHPTMAEGLNALFGAVPVRADGVA
jgi:pyruvate/2-oxoglutarate dehydrogenase complex dihydrolipoamide dehydrogenase (E3) component